MTASVWHQSPITVISSGVEHAASFTAFGGQLYELLLLHSRGQQGPYLLATNLLQLSLSTVIIIAFWTSRPHATGCRLASLEQSATSRHVCIVTARFLQSSEDSSLQPQFSLTILLCLRSDTRHYGHFNRCSYLLTYLLTTSECRRSISVQVVLVVFHLPPSPTPLTSAVGRLAFCRLWPSVKGTFTLIEAAVL